MPRNMRPSEIERRATFVANASEAIRHDITAVLRNLRAWSVGAGGGAAGPSPKNQVSRPVEAQALSKDEFSQARAELVEQMMVADAALRRIERIRRWVMAPPPPSTPVILSRRPC